MRVGVYIYPMQAQRVHQNARNMKVDHDIRCNDLLAVFYCSQKMTTTPIVVEVASQFVAYGEKVITTTRVNAIVYRDINGCRTPQSCEIVNHMFVHTGQRDLYERCKRNVVWHLVPRSNSKSTYYR